METREPIILIDSTRQLNHETGSLTVSEFAGVEIDFVEEASTIETTERPDIDHERLPEKLAEETYEHLKEIIKKEADVGDGRYDDDIYDKKCKKCGSPNCKGC